MNIQNVAIGSENLLNEFEAAEFLGISVASLRTWRSTRAVNIPYIKIGKSIRYSPAMLQKYLDSQTIGGES